MGWKGNHWETRSEARGNGERQSAVDGVAGSGAFPADRRGGGSFGAGRTVIPASGNVLGGDYDFGDYAVLAGCGACGFLAAIRGNGAGSGGRGDGGELLRAACACIRCQCVPPGAALRLGTCGSKRLSIRGNCAGDRVVDTADKSSLANRVSPVRGSVYRDCSGADHDGGMAGEGNHAPGEGTSSSPKSNPTKFAMSDFIPTGFPAL